MIKIEGIMLNNVIRRKINKRNKLKYHVMYNAMHEAQKASHNKSSYGSCIVNPRTGQMSCGHNTIISRSISSKKGLRDC